MTKTYTAAPSATKNHATEIANHKLSYLMVPVRAEGAGTSFDLDQGSTLAGKLAAGLASETHNAA
jgi:hypothetical protein